VLAAPPPDVVVAATDERRGCKTGDWCLEVRAAARRLLVLL